MDDIEVLDVLQSDSAPCTETLGAELLVLILNHQR